MRGRVPPPPPHLLTRSRRSRSSSTTRWGNTGTFPTTLARCLPSTSPMHRTRRPRLVGRCRRARCVMHAMHARVDSGHQPRKVSGAASRSLLALTRLAAWQHAPFPDLQRLSETRAAVPCAAAALPRRCSYPTAARPRFSRACVMHLRRLQVPCPRMLLRPSRRIVP